MSVWKKIITALKKPSIKWLIPFYILTLLCIGSSLTLVIIGFTGNLALEIIAYALFGLSAITLGYAVYTLVLFVPKIKKAIINKLNKHAFTSNLLNKYGFRTVATSILSLIVSVAYALYMGVMGVVARSVWFGALSFYYLCLTAVRAVTLLGKRKSAKESDYALKAFKRSGIFMLLLSFALVCAVLQLVWDNEIFPYTGIMIYVLSAYSFFKITMSIINLIRSRKQDDLAIKSLRYIGFADALVSILSLQTALLSEFSSGANIQLPNALTGGGVCLLTIALSVIMLVEARAEKKKINKETNEDGNGKE